MNKLIICIMHNIVCQKEFEELLQRFIHWSYDIHVFNIGSFDCFDRDFLPSLLNTFSEEQLNGRVVVLSNICNALLFWYCCHNFLVDDFILMIDEKPLFAEGKDLIFLEKLLSFSQIEQELQGKVFLNISPNNYKKILHFLHQNNNHQYFNDFFRFDPYAEPKVKGKPVFHQYKSFASRNGDHHNPPYTDNAEAVNVESESFSSGQLAVSMNFKCPPFLFLYYALYITEQDIVNGFFNRQIFDYLTRIASLDDKQHFGELLWQYMGDFLPGFYQTIYLMCLAILLNPEDARIIEHLFSALEQDTEYLSYHYNILINTLFYISTCNLKTNPTYYSNYRKEMDRLCRWYQPQIPIMIYPPRPAILRIGIHVDQLTTLLHSPSRLILDYARAIRGRFSDARIKIFVEDNLYSHFSEKIAPFGFTSDKSISYKSIHDSFLENMDIEVFYADTGKYSFYRTQEIVTAINDFHPDIILTNSYTSIAMALLYRYYAILHLSMGSTYFTCEADVYLVGNGDEIQRNNLQYQLLDDSRIFTFNYGMDVPLPKQKKHRSDYGFLPSQFLMVTVGNRLEVDMSSAFVQEIARFILNHEDAAWLIVGTPNVSALNNHCADLLAAKRIIQIPYEQDLVALYDLCDVFLNPVRHGGGFSIAWAMSRRIPVLILDAPSNGLLYVGLENSVGSSLEDYGRALELLYRDPAYRRELGERMFERSQTLNTEASMDSLIFYMDLARKHFQKRTQSIVPGGIRL